MTLRDSRPIVRALLLALVLVPLAAWAQHHHREGRGDDGRRGVPEFDAATAGVVAALVAGGGILIARRKRR